MGNNYNDKELEQLGFKSFGKNVLISKKASFYEIEKIVIGNDVRIDDFCILSGKIEIGNYVHISAFCALYGKYGIKIGNFCGCSPRVTIFSGSDDFSGNYMISPMVPEEFTNVISGIVNIEDYVQIGTNSTIMPNIKLKEGSVTGAYSFVNKNLDEWTINIGIPCNKIKNRSKKIKGLISLNDD